jgi:hypothetical protein
MKHKDFFVFSRKKYYVGVPVADDPNHPTSPSTMAPTRKRLLPFLVLK